MIKIGIKEFRYQLNTWLGALVVYRSQRNHFLLSNHLFFYDRR